MNDDLLLPAPRVRREAEVRGSARAAPLIDRAVLALRAMDSRLNVRDIRTEVYSHLYLKERGYGR